MGKGKGISVYYRESKFRHIEDVTTEKIQLTKLSGKSLDLIAVYKAPKGNDGMLRDQLQCLINENRSTIICGDFNLCFVDNRNCRTKKYLTSSKFKQLVHEATHIDGGHIDHVYLKSDCVVGIVH